MSEPVAEEPPKQVVSTLEKRKAALAIAREAASKARAARAKDKHERQAASKREDTLLQALDDERTELEREQLEVSKLELQLEKKRLSERKAQLRRELDAAGRPVLDASEAEVVAQVVRDPSRAKELLPKVRDNPGFEATAQHMARRDPDLLKDFFL